MKKKHDNGENTQLPMLKKQSLVELFIAVIVIYFLGNAVGTFVGEIFFYNMNEADRTMIDVIFSRTLIIVLMILLLKRSGFYIVNFRNLLIQFFVVIIAFVLTFIINVIPGYFMDTFSLTGMFGSGTAENDFGEGSKLLLQFVGAVIFAVATEELVFRGAIFGAIRKKKSFWTAAVISSALFGIFHGISLLMIITFLAGLLLCFIYERTSNILVPMLAHMMNNALGVVRNSMTSPPMASDNGLFFKSMIGNLFFMISMVIISFGLIKLILKITCARGNLQDVSLE